MNWLKATNGKISYQLQYAREYIKVYFLHVFELTITKRLD